MFDWRTVSKSVVWLLDRRYLFLSLVFVYIIVVYFFFFFSFFSSRFFFSLLVSHPAVVMYVSVLRVCVSYFEKTNKESLVSICIVNTHKKKEIHERTVSIKENKFFAFFRLHDGHHM